MGEARVAPSVSDLQRDILETAISSHARAEATQKELDSQGTRLRQSLKDADRIAGQTLATSRSVKTLIAERRAGLLRGLLQCCTGSLCYGRISHQPEGDHRAPLGPDFSPAEKEDQENEGDILVRLERLRSAAKDNHAAASWRRTLVPSSDLSRGGSDIWRRQIELSLGQLQNLSEEMGHSLDKQINQAQMLTVYLNYGVDQVINTNKNLTAAKSLL